MKRWTALTLALVLCLSLTACASEDEKAFEAADALLEAGDYEGALDAFYGIELYSKTAEKIYEIEAHLMKEDIGFLTGVWKDLKNRVTVTFGEDGEYNAVDIWENEWTGNAWRDDNGVLYVLEETTVEEINGVMHLKGNTYELVPEEAFAELGVRDVEITMENWEQYFELREARDVYANGFGEVESINYGYGIFLKDEYVEKLADEYSSTNVTFKVRFDEEHHNVEGDFPKGEYTLGEVAPVSWYEYKTQEEVGEVYNTNTEEMKLSDFYGKYAARIMAYSTFTVDDVWKVSVAVNGEVADVTGTLTMLP